MFTNKLIDETSPYLLQHAHNPVDWYPWGEEALQKAITEDKPILVSIGYAACHWCHVMERESFENEATAQYMNEHFINIKIDREERPDLDHIYMDAVQAMTNSGGWPLNVFLTPDKKPFYGGTYFPPTRAFNRASWLETLEGVVNAFRERRHEIDAQAENLTEHLLQSNSFGMRSTSDKDDVLATDPSETLAAIMKTADTQWGGFGKAPKFPQVFVIQYLLRYHQLVDPSNPVALKQALVSLDKMMYGGLYDQLGGGFARYSTDAQWLAPHFEKMLYDNALLVSVLSEALQLTKSTEYRRVIIETIDFIRRELTDESGGFYAALDADSEGEEGKFYVWEMEEIVECLGKNAPLFASYYDITPGGNWEGKNILRINKPLAEWAHSSGLAPADAEKLISEGKTALMARRDKRVRPALDDKIILGWNALMNTALSKAFAATGDISFRQMAVDNMQFLLARFRNGDNGFYHTWKKGVGKYPAFLDDYAYLIQALLHLQEITADTGWLEHAVELAQFVIGNFSEEKTGFFYYTPLDQADVIVRKKEVYDGAVPSGNAIMADNLYRLGILLDRSEWKERSHSMLGALGRAIVRYPTSFGCWNNLLLEMSRGTVELAVVGPGYGKLLSGILGEFIPNRVLMATEGGSETFPLLAGKQGADPPLVYVCKDYACQQPVTSTDRVMSLIYNRTGTK